MKAIRLIILVNLFSFNLVAQITSREFKTEEVVKPIVYDSSYFITQNITNEEIKKYTGQKIYIVPFSKDSKISDYSRWFYTSKCTNCYYSEDKHFKIEKDSFVFKSLTILDIEYFKRKSVTNSSASLTLTLLFNNDTIYFYDDDFSDAHQPFILSAFFEKSKTQFISKEYIVEKEKSAIDINTGAEILLNKNDKWKCVDVTLLDVKGSYASYLYYIPVLIFRNSNGNEVAINYVENNYLDYNYILPSGETKPIYSSLFVDFGLNINDFKSLELALIEEKNQVEEQKKLFLQKKKKEEERKQNILKKYGSYYGDLVNNNKVVIGMTIDMCKDSWGLPYMKNETITNNNKIITWYYNYKTFLQFSNNKLILINK